MSIVTVEDVEQHLGKQNLSDAQVQQFIGAASRTVRLLLGPIEPETVTEWHDGGRQSLILRHRPVVSVTSITEYAGTTGTVLAAEELGSPAYTASGYRIDTATGIVWRTSGGSGSSFASGSRNVQVVYVAGYSSVPDDIRLAVLDDIQGLWRMSQAAGTQTFESALDGPPIRAFPRVAELRPSYVDLVVA